MIFSPPFHCHYAAIAAAAMLIISPFHLLLSLFIITLAAAAILIFRLHFRHDCCLHYASALLRQRHDAQRDRAMPPPLRLRHAPLARY